MNNKGLDGFALDEFKKFEAGRIEKIIAGHCLVDDIQDQTKSIVVGHQGLIEGILEAGQHAEKLQSS